MPKCEKEKISVGQFDRDVALQGGYLYTTHASRSSFLANQRLTQLTQSNLVLASKRVIDIGCGDGTYTYELYYSGKPKLMVGIDASREAINRAQEKYGKGRTDLIFKQRSCYKTPYSKKSFDIALVRGLLHHLDSPDKALEEISRIAKQIFIIEPNGYNPVLKIIERFSLYHREHKEKSYSSRTLRGWMKNLGGGIEKEQYVGLVPFFCPDWLADILKKIEPFVEKTPFVRNLLCAVYAIKVIV